MEPDRAREQIRHRLALRLVSRHFHEWSRCDIEGLPHQVRPKLASTLHMGWIDANLRVGDEIKIQVIDAPRVDAAATEQRDDPTEDVEGKKRYVRRLARELGWEIRES